MSIQYREGYKYQLAGPYHIQVPVFPDEHIDTEFLILSVSGDLSFRAGYAWDGPSGPALDTPSAMRGSLIHDALYQLMRQETIGPQWRDEADAVYRRLCLEDGMSVLRGWWHFKGVRLFAAGAADPGSAKAIITAP